MPVSKEDLESALAGGNSYQNNSSLDAGSGPNLLFPDDLAQIDHWMAFRINKPVLRKKSDFPIIEDIGKIFLPVPNNLATQYSQNYTTEGIGAAGAAGASAAGSINAGNYKDIGTYKSLLGEGMSALPGMTGYYAAVAAKENLGVVVGAALGGGGIFGAGLGAAVGQFVKGAIAGQGIAINPFMATLYDSPQLRTHQFSWKFIPKNIQESRTLRAIISTFKYYSSPSFANDNSTFFNYPEQFDIDFHHDKFLFNIAPSVLTSFEVNYHGEGRAMYHNVQEGEGTDEPGGFSLPGTTKTPVSVVINATFQEVAIITKNEIQIENR
jgi:hypothetical protein